ncbi:MAG: succinate dehydrogenase, cytochrome b556 subunit [Burkholderiaceae bacterium]|nr:succinate dehydrogenase, cytochrome b556 subunit [Burkholderiaceae bacterium]
MSGARGSGGLPAWRVRGHRGYWAFVGHRVSGLALAAFLPLHFLALGLALEGSAAFDAFLARTNAPLVRVAEWGLVTLLVVHLVFGARLLLLEFGHWRRDDDLRLGWIVPGVLVAAACGAAFVFGSLS